MFRADLSERHAVPDILLLRWYANCQWSSTQFPKP